MGGAAQLGSGEESGARGVSLASGGAWGKFKYFYEVPSRWTLCLNAESALASGSREWVPGAVWVPDAVWWVLEVVWVTEALELAKLFLF